MNPSDLYAMLTGIEKSNRYNYLAMGKLLKELKDGDKFKHAIGNIETWQQFLKQPEIGLSVYRANSLIRVYTNLIEDMGGTLEDFTGISYANLLLLSRQEKITDELIEQATTLSDRDFKEVIVENVVQNYTPTYTYLIMKRCNETGGMRKVLDIPSEIIKETFNLHE